MISPEQFLGNLRTFPIRKEERFDESLIDDFIRAERCGICGAHPPNTVSHIFGRGVAGNWASSIFKMPKCLPCHSDFQNLSTEEFERKHAVNIRALAMLWAEKIAQHLCNKIRELTGEQKSAPRKAKVQQPKKPNSVFKKIKNSDMEKCTQCLRKSLPSDTDRHFEGCRANS